MKRCISILLIVGLAFLLFGCLSTNSTEQTEYQYPSTPEEVWGDMEAQYGGYIWDTLTPEQERLINYPKFDESLVYWTPDGESYHAIDWCYTLSNSSSIQSGTLNDAIGDGKADPCSKCVGH